MWHLQAGRALCVEDRRPFALHFGFDGWREVQERIAREQPFGMWSVLLSSEGHRAPRAARIFTRHYDSGWEGVDHQVSLGPSVGDAGPDPNSSHTTHDRSRRRPCVSPILAAGALVSALGASRPTALHEVAIRPHWDLNRGFVPKFAVYRCNSLGVVRNGYSLVCRFLATHSARQPNDAILVRLDMNLLQACQMLRGQLGLYQGGNGRTL